MLRDQGTRPPMTPKPTLLKPRAFDVDVAGGVLLNCAVLGT
jgi:hypothetical protein